MNKRLIPYDIRHTPTLFRCGESVVHLYHMMRWWPADRRHFYTPVLTTPSGTYQPVLISPEVFIPIDAVWGDQRLLAVLQWR